MGQTLLLLLRKDALTCSLAPDLADRNKAHCKRNIAGMKAPLSRGPQRRLCFGGAVSLCPKHPQPGFPGTCLLPSSHHLRTPSGAESGAVGGIDS